MIFSSNARVPPASLCIHRINLAKQEPGCIDMVDERHLDDQPGFLPEIGLLSVRFFSKPVPPANAKAVTDRNANVTARDHVMGNTVPGLPTPVFVNHQTYACRIGNFDDLYRPSPVWSHRLLADDRNSLLTGK